MSILLFSIYVGIFRCELGCELRCECEYFIITHTWLDHEIVKLKLPRINDKPKIHLRSLGSVNFIDMWQDHEIFVKLTENSQNQVCKHKFTTRISYSVPRGNMTFYLVLEMNLPLWSFISSLLKFLHTLFLFWKFRNTYLVKIDSLDRLVK